MKTEDSSRIQPTRREFLKTSSQALAGAALAGAAARPGYAAEDNTLKLALVGCGGRGTGAAANALQTSGPTKLWAMADLFGDRLENSRQALVSKFGDQVEVPPDRRFLGFDAFQKAVRSLGPNGVVLLATPPAFRPIHFEYAVDQGRHVFMEKSFAVDGPGVRRVLRAGEKAKEKNLKVAGGLMWRHDKPRQEVIQRIHDGAIGEVNLLRTYRMHGPVGFKPKPPGRSELGHQIANYSNFIWVNGSFFVDWLIHNIEVCCWAKNALPVSAQGQGGRLTRTVPDQMYDHYSVEYMFEDGGRLLAQGRHMENCWGIFSDFAHGSKGSARIMENLAAPNPVIYKGQNQSRTDSVWRYDGPPCDPYQVEHDLFFDAIRQDKPYNETERSAHAALVSIMGRMAAESGQVITWEQALNSKLKLAPNLELIRSLDDPAPVQPDANGQYPIPKPGQTQLV